MILLPRRKRSERVQSAPVIQTPEVDASAALLAGSALRFRHRCPACGTLPEIRRYENSPYASEVRIQRLGGRQPNSKIVFMRYEAAEAADDLLATLLWANVAREALLAVLELLPDLYAETGEDVPSVLADAAFAERLRRTLSPFEAALSDYAPGGIEDAIRRFRTRER